LAQVPAAARWRGSAAAFGVSAAVLARDLCLVWADELLRGSGLSAPHLQRAGSVYDAMREDTIRGQYLDLVTQAASALGVRDAWRVAQAKTAMSTTRGPLAFGAVLAGAGESLRVAYDAYAAPLGVAFQLRDDLLGAFGDPAVTASRLVMTCVTASAPCWSRRPEGSAGQPRRGASTRC
jgi:geranylgeranyl diphosphate synthase type I